MNTNNVKKYAPKARKAFIDAMSKQAAKYGITKKKIEPMGQKGDLVLIGDRPFPASVIKPRERLVKRIEQHGFDQVMEHVAYSWFNRLCAIRYMELKGFLDHGRRVLSAADGSAGVPQILEECLDAELPGLDQAKVRELKLDGTKDEELYRELLMAQCHALHQAMPFLFEAVADESELLLPENLTKTDSLIRDLVASIPEEDWEQIEIIGWLYQFYISEKKDQVIGKVVKSEDIPAATQLFTPNWIVKYLVQNSVGRQWLQTYPDSAIKAQMEYYIEPAEQSDEVNQQLKAITPESIEPETIKVLDPACGSGHILIEAYNVLKAIYEERGFRSRDTPKMILENNLYGLDIDDRAAQLSGFALMMMARDDDKRIFTRNVRLNVLSLQESNHIDLPTFWKALNLSGSWQSGTSQGLFSDDEQDLSSFNADNRYQLLKRTLARFTQAKTFGSLIDVPSDEHKQLNELLSTLVELQESGDSMQKPAAKQLIEIVHQALVLSIRYDVVIANPPYMGRKYQDTSVKEYLRDNYPDNDKDLFSAFVCRNLDLTCSSGYLGFMTPFVWMFISSYEHLRSKLLNKNIISSLVQLEYGGFDGATVAVCAFTLQKTHINNYMGSYIRLSDFKGVKNQAPKTLEAIRNRKSYWFYEANQNLFLSIPGKPIAYWVSDSILNSFSLNKSMKDISHSFQGMITGNNDYFLRYWWEVDAGDIKSDACSYEDVKGKQCWLPYSKGGGYRKWFGNNEHVIRWNGTGDDMVRGRTENRKYFFKEGLTWSDIASSLSSFRLQPRSTLFDAKGPTAIFEGNQHYACIGLMNSVFCQKIIEMLNPSVSFQLEEFNKIPIKSSLLGNDELIDAVKKCVSIAKDDWSTKESVLDFTGSAFISIDCRQVALRKLFQENISTDSHMVEKLSALEIKINNLISEAYNFGFSIEEFKLSNVITLTCNPEYEYGTNLIDGEKNAKIQTDKMRSLVSYSIGCMFGRYSVDKKGLVFARSGNDDFEKLVSKETYKTFPADEDGIIPLTNQEWFKDDATNRFREFVQVVWGDDHLQENLDFVAESLCLNAVKPKKSESALETIRRYLSTQFYKDHLKTYKKRPIYWLFSSGKQKAFECLVYLHRYNEGTLARMRTEYVIPLTAKMTAYAQKLENDKEASGSAAEVKRLEKEIAQLHKQQAELSEFDEKLRHYADQRISLDLDDGVKVNYGKFGDLLAEVKAITGEAPEVLS